MKLITFDPVFIKRLSKISRTDTKLFAQIQIQLSRFKQDQKHPSLRIHKLKGGLNDVWSLTINRSYRLLFVEDDEYYFFDLGTHDQVYR